MSTKARARSAKAATAPAVVNTRARTRSSQPQHGKENHGKGRAAPKRGAAKGKAKAVYCVCKGIDDGTPMVECAQCKDWFHFRCLDMSERDFEDISVYICSSCSETTGLRTAMEWEGPEALEEVISEREPLEALDEPPDPPSEPEDVSSEDEYVANDDSPKGRGLPTRRARRLSISSTGSSNYGSETHNEVKGPRARRARRASATKAPNAMSTSPPPDSIGRILKRKTQPAPPSPSKRKKPEPSSTGVEGDPTRKYCLSKYEEMFKKIFLLHPHDAAGQEMDTQQSMSEEDATRLEDEAKKFASELEECAYEIYAERDKDGAMAALGKYKERFRTLSFNLTKDDRVFIHKRIVSGGITPKELSLMSSTDLANEETQQSIKAAEKEALEHSILQKTKVPLAKITHKGLQDIEHDNGEVYSLRAREQDLMEEEAQGDRHRLARLRLAQEHERRPSIASLPPESVPSESPVVLNTPTTPWNANGAATLASEGPGRQPVFVHPPFEFTAEPELSLTDLINIDEEPSPQAAPATPSASDAQASAPLPAAEPMSPRSPSLVTSPVMSTPVSSFAPSSPVRVLPVRRSSFDLNSLWTAPQELKAESMPKREPSPPPQEPGRKDVFVDPDIIGAAADDKDFDMFLDEKEQEEKSAPETAKIAADAIQGRFEALPRVWIGKINMPLDSTIPKETPVAARQIGGRKIDGGSLLWNTLFPSDLLTVAGRVPVDQSSRFLLQNRLNSSRELVAVAFSPATDGDPDFRPLLDFLIAKGRHGLIFPWGQRPKENHPGRELYLIPLLAHDSIPDYMEMLDEFHLPKIRKHDFLVGIWVLNKGKLAPPAYAPTAHPAVTATAPPNLPPQSHAQIMPSILSSAVPPQPFGAAPPAPLPIPSALAPPLTGPFTPAAPTALEAQVASLTPEQIKMMLQTLTTGQALPIPNIQPQQPIQSVMPAQSWMHPSTLYPSTLYPPFAGNPAPQPHPPPSPPSAPLHGQFPPSLAYNRDYRDSRGGATNYDHMADRDRDRDRGWRGRGRGRGRGGRGGRDYRDDAPRGPIDSGWPRRSRNDGGGGGGGPSSPSQNRWV